MQALRRRVALGALALVLATPAVAQENLDAGKSPAQLYAKNCAICHKTPHGLARAGGYGLQRFLREHYTASKESAAAIAAYLATVDRGPAPRALKRGPKKEAAKAHEEKAKKTGETKPAGANPSGANPSGPKPEDAKLATPPDAKAEAKPEPKADAKPNSKSDSKPAAAADAKSSGTNAGSDAKPEKKPD